MKKILATFVLSIVVFNSFAAGDFLTGLKNTAGKKEKLLVIFYKPGCPYCERMDKLVEADLSFQQKLAKNFNIQVYDITSADGRIMADQFNVHSVPSMVNFNTGDASFTVIKGFAGTGKLLSLLGLAQTEDKKSFSFKQPVIQDQLAVCGDGILEAGEGCDDGNVTAGDGCNPACSIEPGFFCTGSPSVCASVCGDGVKTSDEGCDDGNTTNGDGCSGTCNVEPGYYCVGTPSVCSSDAPANDECAAAISLTGNSGTANGQNATATNSAAVPAPSCQPVINGDTWYQFTLSGTKNIRLEVNGPSIEDPILVIYSGTCGSLVQVACDDDSGPGTFSVIQTTLNAGTYFVRVGSYDVTAKGTFGLVYNLNQLGICGNNIIEQGEECDDGNLVNGDNCSSICKIENPSTIKGVSVNEDATPAHPSAMLDVKSFERGILIPRMNSGQRTAIGSPAKGLMVFDNTTNTFWFYNGSGWSEFGGTTGGPGSGLPPGTVNQTLRNNGTAWVPSSLLQNDGTNITVTGQVKIGGGTPAAGKVLTSTDAAGLSSWVTPTYDSTKNTAFTGQNLSAQSFSAAFNPTMPSEVYDDGNNYNPVTGLFTAPATGWYRFEAEAFFNFTSVTALTTVRLGIETPAFSTYGSNSAIIPAAYTGFYALQVTSIAKLAAGTQIRTRINVTGTPGTQSLSSIVFKGYRLY